MKFPGFKPTKILDERTYKHASVEEYGEVEQYVCLDNGVWRYWDGEISDVIEPPDWKAIKEGKSFEIELRSPNMEQSERDQYLGDMLNIIVGLTALPLSENEREKVKALACRVRDVLWKV